MSKEETTSRSRKHKQARGSTPNANTHPAAGGELHQIAGGKHPALTTNQGLALSDNQNSLRANPRGPTLLEDFILREKITRFDHERIPQRIVHAGRGRRQCRRHRHIYRCGEDTPMGSRKVG